MNNYTEIKKVLDIKQKYSTKGDVLFNTSMQYIIEYGQESFNDEERVDGWLKAIDKKHDDADTEGKHLWVARDFEKALIECAVEIAKVDTIDIIKYIQHEWMFYDYNEISYKRALELLRSTIEYSLQDRETDISHEDLEYIGFEDEEIEFLGYGDIFNVEDDE